MKRITLILAVTLFCTTLSAVAIADCAFRNGSGSRVATLDGERLRNSSGSTELVMDSSGNVRNSSNSRVAQISSDGTIRDGSGSRLGEISSSGTVRNGSGTKVGEISGSSVRDASGKKIGEVECSDKKLAAFYFFFYKK